MNSCRLWKTRFACGDGRMAMYMPVIHSLRQREKANLAGDSMDEEA